MTPIFLIIGADAETEDPVGVDVTGRQPNGFSVVGHLVVCDDEHLSGIPYWESLLEESPQLGTNFQDQEGDERS